MIVGHFAVGLALKPENNSIPLWTLFIAVQLIDIVAMILVISGVEYMEPAAGITKTHSMDTFMPYTHSLVMIPVWMLIGMGLYKMVRPNACRQHLVIIALAVGSHWILDFIAHGPDLPLGFSENPAFGLGLWNSKVGIHAVETLMLLVGVLVFRRAKPVWTRTSRIVSGLALALFFSLIYGMDLIPMSATGKEIALMALPVFVFPAFLAYLIEKPAN